MNYETCDEMPNSTISESISKVKRQIETNLFHVHNKFGKKSFRNIKYVYDLIEFGHVVEEYELIMQPIMKIYGNFMKMQYCSDIELIDVFSQYQKIEDELKEAMEKFI